MVALEGRQMLPVYMSLSFQPVHIVPSALGAND